MTKKMIAEMAVEYATLGYKIFPLAPGTKRPHGGLAPHWARDATDDADTIQQWFEQDPSANIGLVCDGLIAIDCDAGNTWPGFERLKAENHVAVQNTPSGGMHFLFRLPPGKVWKNSTSRLATKIDTRGNRGYIVVEPSRTVECADEKTATGDYFFEKPLPAFADLPFPPDWLVEELDRCFESKQVVNGEAPSGQLLLPAPSSTDIIDRAKAYLDACPPAISGQGGHNQTFAVTQSLINGFCLDPDEALRLLMENYNPRCEPPWSDRELRHKVDSAVEHPSDKPLGWLRDGGFEGQNSLAKVDISALVTNASELVEDEEDEDLFGDFRVWPCPKLMEADLSQDFLIENVLVEQQPCIVGGPKKCLKTSLLLDMAISLAAGIPFLRYFKVPKQKSVLIMTGESGLVTIRNTIARIAEATDVDAQKLDLLHVCDKVPRLDNLEHLKTLRSILVERNPDVIIFDPAYLMLTIDKPESLFAVGGQLAAITELCLNHGATIVLAHHNSKGCNLTSYKPDLDSLSWSGFSEFARQWMLLARKNRFDPKEGIHRLEILIGGSYGHSGEYELNISEGRFPSRTWDVELLDLGDLIFVPGENEEERRTEKYCQRVLETLEESPEGISKKKIRESAGLNSANAQKAIDTLLSKEIIEEIEITHPKNHKSYAGYLLVDKKSKQKSTLNRGTEDVVGGGA